MRELPTLEEIEVVRHYAKYDERCLKTCDAAESYLSLRREVEALRDELRHEYARDAKAADSDEIHELVAGTKIASRLDALLTALPHEPTKQARLPTEGTAHGK